MNDPNMKAVSHYCPTCQTVNPGRTWPSEPGDDGRRFQEFECRVCKTSVTVRYDGSDPQSFDDGYDAPDRSS